MHFFKGFLGLVTYTLLKDALFICGDLNFHINKIELRGAQIFLKILDSYNLLEHTTEPTYKSGHILDPNYQLFKNLILLN